MDSAVLQQRREDFGELGVALDYARRLLGPRPQAALLQALEILKVAPRHVEALLILAAAEQALGRLDHARAALQHALGLAPQSPAVWLALGDLAVAADEPETADEAYLRHIEYAVHDPLLMAAAGDLAEDRLPEAEQQLKQRLKAHPTDVAAMRMLAELATRLGRYADAEALAVRCLELAPSFLGARHTLAVVLQRQNRGAEALAQVERLLAVEPDNMGFIGLKAAALTLVGEYEQSAAFYRTVLARHPDQSKLWLSLGHTLRTLGRQTESVEAYHRAIALQPGLGEAWWSLANLKTHRFSDDDLAVLRRELARPELSDDDRLHLHYADGKALEDAGQDAPAFAAYVEGARLRREQVGYDAAAATEQMHRIRAAFTPDLFDRRAGQGCDAADPIFIVGLPRSGSTLIEQVLSSHPDVEGTMELPDLAALAKEIDGYPTAVEGLSPDRLRELGEQFLERTRVQRKSARPFFIDKMPNNFVHTGLIQLILPRAKIIDARRHPMGACFSAFKQHFARGQHFSYGLADLGLYYRDYVELMAHFDEVLPGRVHRVFYEQMVEDLEGETRRLLDYCGLDFDPACLRFYENERAVRTASSEQVRRPIFRDGLDQWRRFEPWLAPLATALGAALTTYRSGTSGEDAVP
ncbi:sulfotransferase [Phenylobacterium sp. LjRoot225]|uniref:tetratricopeptide repeat-containing sulfotransferase family protein n=1 Tax=Phenylobacterium sp. LjRoot225 TaxID=3342285 RepID=UPI003ECD18A7